VTSAFGGLSSKVKVMKDLNRALAEVLSDDAFEVEFIDDLGRALAIEALRRDCLRKVWERGRRVKRAVAGVKVTGER
jgi:hypothetical protein